MPRFNYDIYRHYPKCRNCGFPISTLTKLDGTVMLIHAVPNPFCDTAEVHERR